LKVFDTEDLNALIESGKETWTKVRKRLQELFMRESGRTLGEREMQEACHRIEEVEMAMPIRTGDFTDFSSSKNHAMNIGIMFRGKDNAIHANFLHMPIAYHSRASSVILSGSGIRRPWG
jgi:fumarylacetoacetase